MENRGTLTIETNNNFLPEKQYTFDVLFGEILGIDFQVKITETDLYKIVLPNGGFIAIEDHFFGKNSPESYLALEHIPEKTYFLPHPFEAHENLVGIYGRPFFEKNEQSVRLGNGTKTTTPISDSIDVEGGSQPISNHFKQHETISNYFLGLDLVASSFFMLSRWEEFVIKERDQHGRFPSKAALAIREGFIDRPIVNEYADFLWEMLIRLGWQGKRKASKFRFNLSHDVDAPKMWLSLEGGARRFAGSLLKRRDLTETNFLLKSLFSANKDPYETYDELMNVSEKAGVQSHFNFLGKRSRNSDCYYPFEHPYIKKLMQHITERGHIIGFHPSYEAHEDPNKFKSELESVQRQSPQPVETGRQHFLRFAAPHTWQVWEDAGMKWESSVGYAEQEGFRCGICQEYPVFNFITRKKLRLKEKPLVAMDVTLARYQKFSASESLERLKVIQKTISKHNGEFTLLWHNSSFNDYFWAKFGNLYSDFVQSNPTT